MMVKEKLPICGNLNWHVGAGVDGFEGVHGGFGFGKRKVGGDLDDHGICQSIELCRCKHKVQKRRGEVNHI